MSDSQDPLGILIKIYALGLLAGTIVGAVHGSVWCRQRELLLDRTAAQLDAYLVSGIQQKDRAEAILVYAPRNEALFIYHPETESVEKTAHYYTLERRTPPEGPPPAIDPSAAAAAAGGALGGFTAKDLLTSKYGSRPARVLAAILGVVSGYSFGFTVALRYQPDPESKRIRRLLGHKDVWNDLERRFLRDRAQMAENGMQLRPWLHYQRSDSIVDEYLQRHGYLRDRYWSDERPSALRSAERDLVTRARQIFADADSAGDLTGKHFISLVHIFAAFDTLQGRVDRTKLTFDDYFAYEPVWVRYWWLSMTLMIIVAAWAIYEYLPSRWTARLPQLLFSTASSVKQPPAGLTSLNTEDPDAETPNPNAQIDEAKPVGRQA